MNNLYLIKRILITLFLLCVWDVAFAQVEKTVTLIVSGEASTKDEATKQALRSAIEQAFGTFVSANTEILNDELVKDEIVTLTSGNITNYKEVSSIKNGNTYSVSLQATVSIGKLTNFAKSKGASTELAGAAFAMNMKIKELNKKNEIDALNNLNLKLLKMGQSFYMFDYNLKTGEPYKSGDKYAVDVVVQIKPNDNCKTYLNTLKAELDAISLSEDEFNEYEKANIQTGGVLLSRIPENKGLHLYKLRNKVAWPSTWIANFVLKQSLYSFRIQDNIDHDWFIFYSKYGTIPETNHKFKKVDNLYLYERLKEGQWEPKNNEDSKVKGAVNFEFHFYGQDNAKYIPYERIDEAFTLDSSRGGHGTNITYNSVVNMKFTLYYTIDELNKLNNIKVVHNRSSFFSNE